MTMGTTLIHYNNNIYFSLNVIEIFCTRLIRHVVKLHIIDIKWSPHLLATKLIGWNYEENYISQKRILSSLFSSHNCLKQTYFLIVKQIINSFNKVHLILCYSRHYVLQLRLNFSSQIWYNTIVSVVNYTLMYTERRYFLK